MQPCSVKALQDGFSSSVLPLFTDTPHDHRPWLTEVVEEPHEKVNPVREEDNQVAGGDPMCVLTKFQDLTPSDPLEEGRGEDGDIDSDGFII